MSGMNLGRANGAIGGKLVGAGGGGFLMFYAEDRKRLRQAMDHGGLEEVRFRFDFEGTKVLIRMSLPIAILAGGLGTRLLRPSPKDSQGVGAELAGKPFCSSDGTPSLPTELA